MTLINNQLNTTFQSYLGIMVAIGPTGVKDRLNCGLPKLVEVDNQRDILSRYGNIPKNKIIVCIAENLHFFFNSKV